MKSILSFLLLSFIFLVISSEKINIIKAPYHVQVETNKKFLCSGTIVNYKWLVTTATCVNNGLKRKDIQVRSGSSSLTKNGGVHAIRDIHIHPQYDPSKSKTAHNLALVQLWFHFVLSCTVFPMRMPFTIPQAGESAFYSTFLMNTTRGAHLNMITTSILDWKQCSQFYNDLATDTACIKRVENGCVDEGDPILIDGNIQGFAQNGACAALNTPIILTDLSAYNGWIHDTIKKYTKHPKGEEPPPKDPCTWRKSFRVQ